MKSYFLEALQDESAPRLELMARLPGQVDPWIVWTDDGTDPIAYVNVRASDPDPALEGPYVIAINISGRHYYEDEKIISLLRAIQTQIGGVVRDDFGNTL